METIFNHHPDSAILPAKEEETVHPYSAFCITAPRQRDVRGIVAMSRDGAIGKNGDLPWHLPEDLRHFKELTMGHAVIMGRKTWESLPKRPLPGRRNIVVSHNPGYATEGAETFASIEEAIEACDETPYIIGGASVYSAALPYLTHLDITLIDATVDDADTFFPPLNDEEWIVTEETGEMVSKKGIPYRFITKKRK
ncbi:MAG: dihydrofolate reductase [Muribaculaceae bacterium]|nr:dihydrofolate reductase [Muribaculaceae bacterium]